MSVVGNNRVGIPIVVLHDAEGAVIEVETKKGELIRGLLFEAEDQMNLYIKNAVIRDENGVKRKINQVYVRGPEIVFIVLPDMLKHAPMFNRIKHWRKHGGAPPEGVGQAVAVLHVAHRLCHPGVDKTQNLPQPYLYSAYKHVPTSSPSTQAAARGSLAHIHNSCNEPVSCTASARRR